MVVWDGDEECERSVFVDEQKAKDGAILFVEEMAHKLKCKDILIALSDKLNFRYKVLPTYKHNRTEKEKPVLYGAVKEALIDTFPTEVWPWIEGDDVLGILTTADPAGTILASIDKDLKQIPGWHYHWGKDNLFAVQKAEATMFFYTQVLTGDSTDGYSGCPGVGKVRAERVLSSFTSEEDLWKAVVDVYQLKGLTEEDALQQARVARILRSGEYDKKKVEPILWVPPSI